MGRKTKSTHPAQEAFDFLVDDPVAPAVGTGGSAPVEPENRTPSGDGAEAGGVNNIAESPDSRGGLPAKTGVTDAPSKSGGSADSGAPTSGPLADRSTIQSFDNRSNVDASGAPASAGIASNLDATTVSAAPSPVVGSGQRSEPPAIRIGAPDIDDQGSDTQPAPHSIQACFGAEASTEIDTDDSASGASGRRVLDDGTDRPASVSGAETKCSSENSGVRSIAPTKVAAYSKKSRAKFLERGMSEVRARVSTNTKAWIETAAQESGVSVKDYLGGVIAKYAKRRTHGN